MDIDEEYWFWVLLVIVGIYCFLFIGSLPFAWTIRSVIAICEGLLDKYFDKDPAMSKRWGIAWFDDLDWNLHMNNSSYFKHFDFGRYQFGSKTLGFTTMLSSLSYVASSHARYIKAVKPLTIFQIETKAVYIERKWWLIQQRLISKAGVHCIAIFKIVFKERSGKTIPSWDLIPTVLNEKDKPSIGDPKVLELWEELEHEGEHFYETEITDYDTPHTPNDKLKRKTD